MPPEELLTIFSVQELIQQALKEEYALIRDNECLKYEAEILNKTICEFKITLFEKIENIIVEEIRGSLDPHSIEDPIYRISTELEKDMTTVEKSNADSEHCIYPLDFIPEIVEILKHRYKNLYEEYRSIMISDKDYYESKYNNRYTDLNDNYYISSYCSDDEYLISDMRQALINNLYKEIEYLFTFHQNQISNTIERNNKAIFFSLFESSAY